MVLQTYLLTILSMLFAISMLAMVSEKLKISYPILFVICGLLISFIPNVHEILLNPNVVFLIFLPPLLFFSAWTTSWKNFVANRKQISLLAVGLVVFTSTAIALLAHFLIPTFPLALGFLLGAIISPPDAVAAASVLQNLNISPRVSSILEGESLVNDASSLIIFRFALAAIVTGQFSMWEATGDFFIVAGMGIVTGLILSIAIYAIHKYLPTNSDIDTAMTIIAPYIIYLTAEYLGFSGVMAVVTGGLFLSSRSHKVFSFQSRLQVNAVWRTLNFLLNGFVFILIGLQLYRIVHGLKIFTFKQASFYTIIVCLVTIAIRLLWIYSFAYISYLVRRRRNAASKEKFNAKATFIIGWSGMRGIVSLASALSLPLLLPDGSDFPHRNIILFITFGVILFTLVLQGLSLPILIRLLKISYIGRDSIHDQEAAMQTRLETECLNYLLSQYPNEENGNSAASLLISRFRKTIGVADNTSNNKNSTGPDLFAEEYQRLLIQLVTVRRRELQKIRNERIYIDEIINTREYELDHEEARLHSVS